MNLKNKDDQCVQYLATAALNYKEIKWNLERGSNIKPFMNKYSWDELAYSLKIDNWKIFEKHNLKIALHVLYTK